MRRVLGRFFGTLTDYCQGAVDTRKHTRATFPRNSPEVIVEIWDVRNLGKPSLLATFTPGGWALKLAAMNDIVGRVVDEAEFADAVRP